MPLNLAAPVWPMRSSRFPILSLHVDTNHVSECKNLTIAHSIARRAPRDHLTPVECAATFIVNDSPRAEPGPRPTLGSLPVLSLANQNTQQGKEQGCKA
jgi:hypothetical protein